MIWVLSLYIEKWI